MKATIYIPEHKSELYEKAKTELGDTISATFVRCLERELESKRVKTERIVVEISDAEERVTKKAFEGRWLVGRANGGEGHYFDEESTGISGGGHYSVALTKKGQIAVCTWDRDELIRYFTVYPDFDDFSTADNGGFPGSLIAAVAAELDIDHIEEIDI